MSTTIVWIHGNGATSDSFNYLKEELIDFLPENNLFLEYSSDDGFQQNLAEMHYKIYEEKTKEQKLVFIGHSLGGCYAAYLASDFFNSTLGGITMSTPWKGSEIATWLQFTHRAKVYKDIAPFCNVIQGLKSIKLPGNWTGLVSVKGESDLINKPNDGVISFDSMYGKKMNAIIEIASSHHEIVLSNHTVSVIQNTLGELLC